METRSNNVLVGVVTLLLLAALAVFFIWLSRFGEGGRNEYDIFFKQSVGGLAKGSEVTFAGVPSGQVKDIKLWKNDPEFVRVRISIDDQTPVLQGTVATIQSSFTGTSTVQLDGAVRGAPAINEPGPGGVPVIPTKPGALGELLNNAPLLLERLSTLTERLSNLLSERNQESIGNILDNVERTTDTLARTTPQIEGSLADARVAIQQAGNAADQIGRLAGSTADMVDNEGRPLAADLRKTIAAAAKSMEALEAATRSAQPGIQTFSTQTLPEVNLLVRDLRAATKSLKAITEKIDNQGATSLLGSPKLPDYKP